MKKEIFILTLALFGFLLIPTLTFACGQTEHKTEKSCCENENSYSNKDNCCKDRHSHHQSHDEGCGSNCNHSACHCVHCNIIPCIPTVVSTIFFAEKQLSIRNKTFLSSEFLSIWVPPKIG